MHRDLIKKLEELKTDLHDQESALLAGMPNIHGMPNDFNNNKLRRIEQLRNQKRTLSEAITILTALSNALE